MKRFAAETIAAIAPEPKAMTANINNSCTSTGSVDISRNTVGSCCKMDTKTLYISS